MSDEANRVKDEQERLVKAYGQFVQNIVTSVSLATSGNVTPIMIIGVLTHFASTMSLGINNNAVKTKADPNDLAGMPPINSKPS